MSDLKYFKIDSTVLDPEYGTEDAACFDLHAFLKNGQRLSLWSDSSRKEIFRVVNGNKIMIYANERMLVPTGLIFDIPTGYSLRLYARSGLAFKQGLILANSVGVIDSDYTQQTMCIMHNCSENNVIINNGDRICQGELISITRVSMQEISQPPEIKTDRIGGFGSTGV